MLKLALKLSSSRRLMKKVHPDMFPEIDNEMAKKLTEQSQWYSKAFSMLTGM